MISTLEEISLHQEELESIREVLGTTCRKLKILYLQVVRAAPEMEGARPGRPAPPLSHAVE